MQLEPTAETDDVLPGKTNTAAMIDELNKLYTPILVANELDVNIADRVRDASPKSGNLIKFDDETRKAQLISVCARLVAKFNRSPEYDTYLLAARAAKAAKLDIQKINHAAAIALADEYLAQLAATSDSADISQAAKALSSVKVTLG